MSGGASSTLETIDAVDAFASTLYLRASQDAADAPLADVAVAVRQLHHALRHLRVEAADPDSLLNSAADASLYVRQLRPVVEDCSFALKQLETILDKYGVGGNDGASRERAERLGAIRAKLSGERRHVEMFLDTVQLHNPANQVNGSAVQDSSQTSLEGIKDKVDAIAQRLFSRRDSGFADNYEGEGLWREFKAELEAEGFSREVLHRHKDVLRAYIRELESVSCLNGGAPPRFRGLLEHEARSAPSTPKEVIHPEIDNEKCFPSMKQERRMPDHAPADVALQAPPRLSYEQHSSGSSDDAGSDTSGDSLALISTKDLMAMDALVAGMGSMQLQHALPHSQNYTMAASPRSNQKYLPSSVSGALPAPPEAELSASPNSQTLGTSPRFVPPLPAYANSLSVAGPGQRRPSHLAPDRYGNEIPLDAQWTRIKRTIVSPEVLERAGVRYEARPEYVAVLGRLSREQIADFARKSADVRAARSGRTAPPVPRKAARDRADSKSSREDEDEDSVLWDESDTTDYDDDRTSEKGHKSYPYIVPSPEKDKTSPNSKAPPKPILKNKNENHVRFDPEPHEFESKSPRSLKDDYPAPSSRRGGPPPRRSHRDSRHGSESRYDRRNGGSDRDRYGDYHRSSHRDRRSDRDRGDRRDRSDKKKAWGETLGAVGIGGAAVSLLGVLAEAAGSMS